MADFTLTPTALLGADVTIGANRITERADLALVSVAAPLGGDAALAGALSSGWGLEMPTPTRASLSGEMRAVQLTADQLLLVFPHSAPDAEPTVQAKLQGAGYTTDQTDAWLRVEISGPDTRAALERICPIDLGAQAFAPGAAARTVMEHMGTVIVALEPDRYLLLSASSTAGSFLHALETSLRNVTS